MEDTHPEMKFTHFSGTRRSPAKRSVSPFVVLLCPGTKASLFKDLTVKLVLDYHGCHTEMLPLFLIKHVSHVACQRNSESQAQNGAMLFASEILRCSQGLIRGTTVGLSLQSLPHVDHLPSS